IRIAEPGFGERPARRILGFRVALTLVSLGEPRQSPPVVADAPKRIAKQFFRFVELALTQHDRTERLPDRVVPVRWLHVRERVLDEYRLLIGLRGPREVTLGIGKAPLRDQP